MAALRSPMIFAPNTIDKPGKPIARAIHGQWMAPPQEFDHPDAGLLIGVNPFVSYKGLPKGNQSVWLSEAQRRGMKLIVIDPRRSDIARRAWLFIQPRPGHDAPIIAAMLTTIIEERLYDEAFVRENVRGLDELAAAVRQFDADRVAKLADVDPHELRLAARVYAGAKRGYSMAGTGPSMSGPGTLIEYLMLCLEALCGRYLRAGERVLNPGALLATRSAIAQAKPPSQAYGYGERMRVRGLTTTSAGVPTAALAEEILMEGPGQVRALISCAGNPVAAWPDQLTTIAAIESLELLVQVDPWMSQTATFADFVIAPRMPLETPGTTQIQDFSAEHAGTGYAAVEAYAQYSPAIVDPPEGSDLIEDWEFFYRLAQRMGLTLELGARITGSVAVPLRLDMDTQPTSEEMLELVHLGSRIPLSEVRKHPHGSTFVDPPVYVAPKEPGWTGRLEVGSPDMMSDLDAISSQVFAGGGSDEPSDLPFRLVCRRMQHVYNSSCNDDSTNHGRPYNPAYLHPEDLEALGMTPGDIVEIRSRRSMILGIVQPDDSLRRGLVSMTHGFGGPPGSDRDDLHVRGSNVDRLLFTDERFDRYSGQPLMSNVPVAVTPCTSVV
jgi:anaerobic selenocysteine-containing dehydrogenase